MSDLQVLETMAGGHEARPYERLPNPFGRGGVTPPAKNRPSFSPSVLGSPYQG